MLKALVKGSEEDKNFRKFHGLRSSRNHIIQADIVECENCVMLIMPRLTRYNFGWMQASSTKFFDFIAQIIEVSDHICLLLRC